MRARWEAWHEAISRRKSRRRFEAQEIEPELLSQVDTVCREFRPFGASRTVLVRRAPPGVFRGVVGSYGKVKGAPSCLVMVGPQASAAQVGYVGEAAVLEATSLGLDTCWVGGLFEAKLAASLVELAPGERVFAVSPLGRAAVVKTMEERLMSSVARSHYRKRLPEIAPGIETEAWPEWAMKGIEAARLAPSAVNRQPWRFRFREATVVLSVDIPRDTYKIPKRLDCGIAMLHFELGAWSEGVSGEWAFMDPPEVAVYRPGQARQEVRTGPSALEGRGNDSLRA